MGGPCHKSMLDRKFRKFHMTGVWEGPQYASDVC